MGKLVLHLADGTTLDIRLARERITIGRRADNDVCLPYPAVSGEHAAVVTILADSFLEDLGSTNGTLVNGKPIAKHFLRDRDEIDIGRQKLVYLADESETLDPVPPSLGRLETRIYGERVAPARPPASVAVPEAGSDESSARPADSGEGSMADIDRFVVAELGATRSGAGEGRAPGAPEPSADPAPAPTPDWRLPDAAVRILTGPSAGREVVLEKAEVVIGRVGVQVAVVRPEDGSYRLVPLEGANPIHLNGTPVAAAGEPLRPGDRFEIAGVRLEMVERPRGSSR